MLHRLKVTNGGIKDMDHFVLHSEYKPTLVIAHNKTLAAQLYGEFKEFFLENAVEYFVF